jgi:hypothetical protein
MRSCFRIVAAMSVVLLVLVFGHPAPAAVPEGESILVGLLLLFTGDSRAADVNLARGQRCSVFSSLDSDGWSAARLTDGETDTGGWSSKAFAAHADHRLYPEFIVVDLGKNCAIGRVVLHPTADGQGFPEDFTIQTCREGAPWRVAVERRGCESAKAAQVHSVDDIEARFVKVAATRLRQAEQGVHRFQLAEVEVWGQPKRADALTSENVPAAEKTRPTRLRCENRDHPLGVDAERPRLSWWMESPVRGEKQTAYRVLVASTAEKLAADVGDLWQGAVWSPTDTMVIRGLERYKKHDLAAEIALEHLERVAQVFRATGTVWENYAPDAVTPGKPAKGDFVGWTGIVPILYFIEYRIGLKADAPNNRLTWALTSARRCGCERFRFAGHTASLVAEPNDAQPDTATVTVASDGVFDLRVERAGKQWDFSVQKGNNEFVLK